MPALVEYLVIIKKPGSFCDSVGAFLAFLQTDSRFKVTGDVIHFDGEPVSTLRVSTGDVPAKDQRYFHLTFTWALDPDTHTGELGKFIDFLKAIRIAMDRIGGEVEQLRNDISSHLSRKAYPLIQEVENTMRRLITNFMMVNVGLNWADEALPPKVGESVERSRARELTEEHADKENLHVLYKLDFDQLGNVLFDSRTQRTVSELYGFLEKEGEIDRIALEQFLPRSNWDRYFAKVIDCDDKFLKTRWEKLYKLRCKVAHNRMITEQDLENTKRLVSEVLPKLQDAIAKLSQVAVPPTEAEGVAESAASSTSAIVGQFILKWQELEGAIATRLGPQSKNRLIFSGSKLKELGFLSSDYVAKYEAVRELRNQTVHGRGAPIDEASLMSAVFEMEELQWWIESESFYDRLKVMKKDERRYVLDELLCEQSYSVISSEEFSSAIAESNATGFDHVEFSITEIGFDDSDRTCVVDFTFESSGESDDEKPFCGDTIRGSGRAWIDPAGSLTIMNLSAGLEHWEPDEDEDDEDRLGPDDVDGGGHDHHGF